MFTKKKFFLALGVTTSIGSYVAYQDEGTRRSVIFWQNIFPIYAHYRYIQFLNRDLGIMSDQHANETFEKIHEKYTDKVKDIVYSMRGFYLKQAQLMSTQDHFVPKAYMKWVKDTQDNVPSEFKGTEAREFCAKLLREEQGLDFDSVFSEWNDEPLGVASIGQVHKARLRKTNEEVAVKLLIPGIEPKFRADIKTLKYFCKLAMPQHVSAFEEIEKQFCTEFDYREEAKNLKVIHDFIMPKWSKIINIPEPILELSSQHVLVMEYLEGVKLVDGIRSDFKKVAEKTGQDLDELENERKKQIAEGSFVFKSIDEDHRERSYMQNLLLLNDLLKPVNLSKIIYNLSPLRLIYGPSEIEWSELPLDLGHLLEILANVHANQIFEFGIFNGDPHPGNILLLKDKRLGLIDYGQVKRMTVEQRIIYAKLIIAHARDDKEEIVRLQFEEAGMITKYKKREIAYLMSTFYNDRDTDEICHGMNISEFIDWLQSQDPMVRLPEEYIFASRVNIMLRGMGNAFGIKLKMSKLWEEEARKFLISQGINY